MNETIKLFILFSFSLVLFVCFIYVRYPKDIKFNNIKSKKASSFHEFACSTNDAWDIDDEKDEGFLGPSDMHSPLTQIQVLTRLFFNPYGLIVEFKQIFHFVSTAEFGWWLRNWGIPQTGTFSDRISKCSWCTAGHKMPSDQWQGC